LIKIIKNVINVPCNTLAAPKFSFELLTMAASRNLAVLSKYNNDLNKALKANKNPPFSYGSEFRQPKELCKIFGLHHLWPQMEAILIEGSKWPLEKINEEAWQTNLHDALKFGNHK
jgi:hypothetical protein